MQNVELLITYIAGTLSGLTVAYIWLLRKRKIKEKIDNLKWEKEHITKIRKSSIEFNRYAFQSILWVLLFLIAAEIIERVFLFIGGTASFISQNVAIVCWALAGLIAINDLQRFMSVSKYQKAMKKIDNKITVLEEKLSE